MELKNSLCIMLFGKIFYMIHRTISVRFLRDTIRSVLAGYGVENCFPDVFVIPGAGCSVEETE